MKTTLKQIAQESGVSISTVSRVVTGKGYVSDEAREQIRLAMDKLGYVCKGPQPHIRKESIGLVMILVGGVRSSLASQVVELLVQELEKKQKRPFVAITSFSPEKERSYLQFAADNHFFGVIAMTITETSETLAMLRNFPCPVIMLERYLPSLEVDCLRCDYYRMGFVGAQYLIDHGHRKIGFIGGRTTSTITQDKKTGFEDCMQSHHLPLNPDWIMHVDRLIYENGTQIARQLLALPEMPTAIVSSNDISVGILNELILNNVRVPRDISIFTCEDSTMAAHCQVPLTAMSINFEQMAANAVKILCWRRRSPSAPRNLLVFSPQLVVRNSVSSPTVIAAHNR